MSHFLMYELKKNKTGFFSRVLRVSKLFVFIAPIIFQHVCLPTKPKAVCFDNILYSTNCNYLYMYIQYLKRMNFELKSFMTDKHWLPWTYQPLTWDCELLTFLFLAQLSTQLPANQTKYCIQLRKFWCICYFSFGYNI